MHNSFSLQQYVCYTTILNMFRAARCSSSGGQIVSPQPLVRGELSYLEPLGRENISDPYFKQCFFQGGGVLPPRLSQTPRLPVPRQK